MPNSQQHKKKAQRNRAFLDTIPVDDYPDWAAAVAFYTAVHLAERLRTLESKAGSQHSRDHDDRNTYLQRRHPAIYPPFQALYDASLLARYSTTDSFNKKFPVQAVRDVLIGDCLVRIERYVAGKFGER